MTEAQLESKVSTAEQPNEPDKGPETAPSSWPTGLGLETVSRSILMLTLSVLAALLTYSYLQLHTPEVPPEIPAAWREKTVTESYDTFVGRPKDTRIDVNSAKFRIGRNLQKDPKGRWTVDAYWSVYFLSKAKTNQLVSLDFSLKDKNGFTVFQASPQSDVVAPAGSSIDGNGRIFVDLLPDLEPSGRLINWTYRAL